MGSKMKGLEELGRILFDIVKGYIETHPDKEAPPSWFLFKKNGDSIHITTPFFGEDTKNVTAAEIRQKIAENNVVAYFFVSEGWSRTVPTAKIMDLSIPVRDHPDRTEVLVVNGEDRGGATVLIVGEIAEGRKVREPEVSVGGKSESRFVGMFKEPERGVRVTDG
jgi:hypothetical protein